MAIVYENKVPDYKPSDAEFPNGSIKTGDATENGTALVSELFNDIVQTFDKLVRDAGITKNDEFDGETNGYQLLSALVAKINEEIQPTAQQVSTNTGNISSNTTAIGNNTSAISNNANDISNNANAIAGNANAISSNANAIAAIEQGIVTTIRWVGKITGGISNTNPDVEKIAGDLNIGFTRSAAGVYGTVHDLGTINYFVTAYAYKESGDSYTIGTAGVAQYEDIFYITFADDTSPNDTLFWLKIETFN